MAVVPRATQAEMHRDGIAHDEGVGCFRVLGCFVGSPPRAPLRPLRWEGERVIYGIVSRVGTVRVCMALVSSACVCALIFSSRRFLWLSDHRSLVVHWSFV